MTIQGITPYPAAPPPVAREEPELQLPSDANRTGRDLGREEIALLTEAIRSGTLNCTRGTQVNGLEREFAALYGVAHAVAVSSGTAAVHAAIVAIDPQPGDEIITTPVTDMGAIAPILYQRAIPIFADVEPDTLNVTAASIAARITPRTRAIIATHLFGRPCDIAAIRKLGDARGIAVIEDCAQAYLARHDGRLVGTIGSIGVFSLQQGKHMTCGEGGLVITDSDAAARRVRLFINKAWDYGDPHADHTFLALNYRMTELQGAVARAQLAKLPRSVSRRRRAAARLNSLLADVAGLRLPGDPLDGVHAYWRYPLFVDPQTIPGGADALGGALRKRDVACAPRYVKKPAFQCAMFVERNQNKSRACACPEHDGRVEYDTAEYPGTLRGLERVVVLPWNELYRDEHVDHIARVVRRAVEELRAAEPRVRI